VSKRKCDGRNGRRNPLSTIERRGRKGGLSKGASIPLLCPVVGRERKGLGQQNITPARRVGSSTSPCRGQEGKQSGGTTRERAAELPLCPCRRNNSHHKMKMGGVVTSQFLQRNCDWVGIHHDAFLSNGAILWPAQHRCPGHVRTVFSSNRNQIGSVARGMEWNRIGFVVVALCSGGGRQRLFKHQYPGFLLHPERC
jgi:hypothetical protein